MKQLINISNIFINFIHRNFTFCILFIFIIQYIEGIINILNNLLSYIYVPIKINSDLNKNKNEKKYRKYVDIHKWSNVTLNDDIKYIIYKPLRWRPTLVNKLLFQNEIKQLNNEICNKFKKIVKNIKCKSIFETTKIINSYNKFQKILTQKLFNYLNKIKNKTIRNINICYNQIKQIKLFKSKYNNLLIMDSDKNRGNVIMYKSYWHQFNIDYLENNDNNFDIIKQSNLKLIISKSKSKLINIITKYKYIINDYKKALNITFSGINDKIGIWAPIPKVHKVDNNNNPIRKLRPIINLKNTIITIPCAIVREISRKIIFRIKTMYQNYIECDDVKDIIFSIMEFNKNNTLNIKDKLVVCDINSMYDVITPNMVKNAFECAIFDLIPNYLNQDMINLWYKSMKYIFEFCYFKYQKVLYLLKNTQIQGSKSGGDNCNLYLVVHEIKNALKFQNLTKIILRYKDDIFCIPKTNINISSIECCKNNLINILYPQFDFEYDINREIEICDVKIGINYQNMKLSTTTLVNHNKITSFINKSSNVNQSSINGIFKVLQMRYILLDDDIIKYKYTKSRICNIFIENNEWTPVDLRLCEHISYSQRDKILKKYMENKDKKYNEYIKMNKINLFDNKWWDKKDDDKININSYLTYQKTLIDEREIQNIINNSFNYLHEKIKDKYQLKLFYKYQQPIRSLLQ